MVIVKIPMFQSINRGKFVKQRTDIFKQSWSMFDRHVSVSSPRQWLNRLNAQNKNKKNRPNHDSMQKRLKIISSHFGDFGGSQVGRLIRTQVNSQEVLEKSHDFEPSHASSHPLSSWPRTRPLGATSRARAFQILLLIRH